MSQDFVDSDFLGLITITYCHLLFDGDVFA